MNTNNTPNLNPNMNTTNNRYITSVTVNKTTYTQTITTTQTITKIASQHKKACKNCTRLHHKCDKKMPCNYCTKRGITCEVNPCIKKRGRPFGSTNKNKTKTKRDVMMPKRYKKQKGNEEQSMNETQMNQINSQINKKIHNTSQMNQNFMINTPNTFPINNSINPMINPINTSVINKINLNHINQNFMANQINQMNHIQHMGNQTCTISPIINPMITNINTCNPINPMINPINKIILNGNPINQFNNQLNQNCNISGQPINTIRCSYQSQTTQSNPTKPLSNPKAPNNINLNPNCSLSNQISNKLNHHINCSYKDDNLKSSKVPNKDSLHPNSIHVRTIRRSKGDLEMQSSDPKAPPILINWDYNVDVDSSMLDPIFSFESPLENNDLFSIF
eukprot:TRINITY_DN2849_c0_g1_i1.p1 TRINITY_DN2849_c0_g1~~TRINITY_DN2849_c0_g1_i1.p1  ORF type:complete len:392 (-),score=103.55 TRINITY_DN2849_c0_g1_i1:491-1666(-)